MYGGEHRGKTWLFISEVSTHVMWSQVSGDP